MKIFSGIIFSFLIGSLLSQVSLPPEHGINSTTSHWRATLSTPGGELPFIIELNDIDQLYIKKLTVLNGVEQIAISEIDEFPGIDTIHNLKSIYDSTEYYAKFPVFNTAISFWRTDNFDTLYGYWRDRSRSGYYALPFFAIKLNEKDLYRFIAKPKNPISNISGKWDVIFKDESSSDSTVGIFEQKGNHLSGTFLTTTGDYRFLEGDVSADSFYLSAFDGSHAFLFKGQIHKDGTLSGGWWSGKHYNARFTATKNENAKLPDARSLTYIKEGYSGIDFSFPDENGKMISINDEQFKNKPLIIVITGTWCPNCMDETSFLSEVEEKYKEKIGIIALSFERQPDPINFKKNISKEREHFGIEYTILNAGLPKDASAELPMLNKVMGFPTTIILNRNHEVVEIYTGFSGPATGDIFVSYQEQFYKLLNELSAD